MTSHNDQIRALIAEIDATLEKPSNFLGRLSGEGAKNRETLEHLRGYLFNLQNSLRKARIRNHPAGEDLAALLGEATLSSTAGGYEAQAGFDAEQGQSNVVDGETVHDEYPLAMGNAMAGEEAGAGSLTYGESTALIQQLDQDLEQLRAGLMIPLRTEVNQLQQQRQALAQEVQQLQLQRSGVQSEQLLQEFMQTLMTRLQEQLVAQVTAQISQALQGMPQISGNTLAALPGETVETSSIQLDQLQGRTDALLSNLNSTLKAFAQTLEQNVQGYHQSLDQGVERINRMGGQGEAIVAELVNRLADQMEAQGSIQWNELGNDLSGTSPALSIGGESPMGRANGSFRQLSSHSLENNSIALDGPELTLDSLKADAFEEVADKSTSSAGIARRRILAAQHSESQAQQSLELDSRRKSAHSANSLEDFYASVGAPNMAQQRAMAVQNRANLSRPGAVKGHYRNLEDALFDGIPEGDNPWASAASRSSASQPQLRAVPNPSQTSQSDAYPPQSHQIQSLTDLVDRRFDDFGNAEESAQEMPEAFAAFYGDRSTARQPAVKKKPFLSWIHPLKSA